MEDWSPDEVSRAEQRTAYLWIVPAPVEGTWNVQLTGGPTFDMTLTQKFQKLEGTLAFGTVEAGLREPVLRGDAIHFGFVGQDGVWYELAGTAADGKMSGTYQVAGTSKKNAWTATRK
jgi:hypothetical protein